MHISPEVLSEVVCPSLISLMVSVDVKHHVYLLTSEVVCIESRKSCQELYTQKPEALSRVVCIESRKSCQELYA